MVRASAGLVVTFLLLCATPTIAQQSRCADCHFANPNAPAVEHQGDWDRSEHRRKNIGCETCHGGDASTFESLLAHRGILRSTDPASPAHRRNISATCGGCHTGPFVAFRKSRHFDLLAKGDGRVPVCSTCHGAAGFRRQSPRALEIQCRECHGARGIAPRPEEADATRALYEALNETRDVLRATRPLINRVRDRARRGQLNDAHQQAELPLIQAVQAGHEFVYDNLKERLSVARLQLEAMLGQLANPKPVLDR